MTTKHGLLAFTLVELVVATGVGMFVLVTAYGAVRTASRSIQAADRLALENRLLRAGFVYALDEIDYWTLYDDPSDPGNQPLRGTATTDLRVQFGGDLHTSMTFGLPFTAVKDLPPEDYDTGTLGVRLRPETALLPSPAELVDDSLGGAILDRDLDRGIDMHRPYNAADRRHWTSAGLVRALHDNQTYGRYGLFSHLKRRPTLGHGQPDGNPDLLLPPPPLPPPDPDPRNAMQQAGQRVTGQFGQVTAGEARTLTYQQNAIDYAWKLLGNYGAIDYLPANTLYGVNFWRRPLGPLVTDVEEAVDNRYAERLRSTQRYDDWRTHAVVPASPYSGRENLGYGVDATFHESDNGASRGDELSAAMLVRLSRIGFLGEYDHISRYGGTYNRLFQMPTLTPQRPAGWPDLRLGLVRTLTRGRPTAAAFIRWQDQATGKEVELEVTALGTSLRGARQQRHRDGGWATFYGIRYDLATGVLWDNPRKTGDTGYTTAENNHPTLDYPANDALVPGRR